MSELSALVNEYLAFREARGFQPNRKLERLLLQFADAVAGRVDGPLFSQSEALAWAHAPAGAAPAWWAYRLSAVRGFAVYLAGSGLPVGVPGTRQGPGGPRRATPYLFTTTDVQALMRAADEVFTPLRAATMKTLAGLMAVTGMRIGEALQLAIADLDLDHGVVLIANAKYGRQRLVQLHPSSRRAVAGYLGLPARRRLGVTPERPVLVTTKGGRVHERTAHAAFHQMICHAGLPLRAGARPRPHGLRHTFATQTMIDAYQAGRDPARTLTLLSVWLGHANPADTYWYLQAAPEVAALAALRLEATAGGGES
jgi:integrase